MPDYFFSGVDRQKHFSLLAAEGAKAMLNATTVKQPRILEQLRVHPSLPVVLDSGAFQGKQDVAEYAQIIIDLERRFPGRFRWFASLDSLGDQAHSDENYQHLLFLLPIRVRHRLLWIFQCNEALRPGGLDRLHEACQLHDRMGLGGLVPLLKSPERALQVLQEIGKVLSAQIPLPKIHVFGVGSSRILAWLRCQPWFDSADSSKMLVGYRNREVVLLNGKQRHATRLHLALTPDECAALTIRSLHNWLDPSLPPFPSKSLLIDELSARFPSPLDRNTRDGLHARIALVHDRSEPAFEPRYAIYVPLFSYRQREYGLINYGGGIELSPEQQWMIVWEPHDTQLPWVSERETHSGLFLDERQVAALHRHGYGASHFPFHLATAVARSLVAE